MHNLILSQKFSVINSENDLVNIFYALMDKGLNPFEAYDYVEEKFTEEEIFKYIKKKNSNFIKVVKKSKIEFLIKKNRIRYKII